MKALHTLPRIFVVISLIFSYSAINGQIVNIESMRMGADSTGLDGQLALAGEFSQDANTNIDLAGNLLLIYKSNPHQYLVNLSAGYGRVDTIENEYNLFGHLRYNYRFNERFVAEVFVQSKTDEFLRIQRRDLYGAGIRIKLAESQSLKFYGGITAMYEHEILTGNKINDGVRMSDYLSLWYKKDNVAISLVGYYQPRMDAFRNYRLSLDNQISVKIFRKVSFLTSFSLGYDSRRPEDIPNTVYEMKAGIGVEF